MASLARPTRSDTTTPMTPDFAAIEFALQQDAADPLARLRQHFEFPRHGDGLATYLCGHSLGLKPDRAADYVNEELASWGRLGVEAHFKEKSPWYSYHELLTEPGARLVGALPSEVVFMNSLTVNLHLMLASFYRPTPDRAGILIDEPTFPSDRYAVTSVLGNHGFDPNRWLIAGDDTEALLAKYGDKVAVCVISAVNYFTGRFHDVPRLAELARQHGCVLGLDLAHAAGNVPLRLHEWGVDFAVWCSYKYLNSGPGAVGGCFVHERHANRPDLPRLAGWWGNDPATRFRMHLEPQFVPKQGADGWQLSNPPILAMAPIRASLELFDVAEMRRLRAKSEVLTRYLERLLDCFAAGRFKLLTPREPARRGSMLSLQFATDARAVHDGLQRRGIVCDFRPPDVIRVTPAPLYNSFEDAWRFAAALKEELATDEIR